MSYFYAALCVMLGAGGYVLTAVAHGFLKARRQPPGRAEARLAMEAAVVRVVTLSADLFEACHDLAALKDSLPPEFAPVAEQTLRYAQLIEEATYKEGQRRGIYARPRFTAEVPAGEQQAQQTLVVGGQIVP